MSLNQQTESRTASYLARTRGFLRTQLWVWPLVAAVLLAFVGVSLRLKMEAAMKQQIAGNLQVILNANAEALRAWATTVKSDAEILADDEHLRDLVAGLLQKTEPGTPIQSRLLAAPELAALRAQINPWLDHRGFNGFVVLDPSCLVIASRRDQLVGMTAPPGYVEQFSNCLASHTIVTKPFPSVAMLPDAKGNLRAGVPTMFAAAPVKSADGKVIAVLGLRIAPEKDFTRILATARAGASGETYAFARNGLLLSESRFDDELRRLGLIPDSDDANSILTLELRDPLVDLSQGKSSPKRRSEQALTKPVAEAGAGREGVDVDGYRDYRGVKVVGAWQWFPEFDFGLVTEMDVAEAFHPLHIMRMGFWFIFGLLVVGSVVIYVLMRLANRLQATARKAALKAKQLGQYALDDKIGAGAFGSVYRAHHALMRRPVAVKLLESETADANTAARFEQEVQMTSQLTHPNTIALYDYGRTPEGIFYYAMEYLEGLTLDKLVKNYGPQPECRVIAILCQMCGSLAEAHGIGLVHRDIKPANVFLTRRGGLPDFVKVLDFGLVKARATQGQLELTGANTTLGTPLYMSPEAVEHPDKVDARADIYSVGAVGYFLVTGQPLFDCATLGEVLVHQVKHLPARPSERLGKPVSPELENLLMRCLAKNPADRPASARELADALAKCPGAAEWTRERAEEWWSRLAASQNEKTLVMPA
ncbi:MAG: serine/threonine protein kinase [Verrucomicrobiales bacterium]|nr:serine/threonine protein kinase [Verrucomicrobiales bacterium]